MRALMPLLIGLVLGTGTGTGLFIMRGGGEAAEAPADTVADSTAVASADTAEADVDGSEDTPSQPDPSDPPTEALADGGPPSSDPSGDVPATETGDGQTDAPAEPTQAAEAGSANEAPLDPQATTVAADTPTQPSATPTQRATTAQEGPAGANLQGDEEAAKRLARIFSSMQARDAAKVLSLMDRSEMELVLRQLSNRAAAQILAGLDAELAADLSQALMKPGGNR